MTLATKTKSFRIAWAAVSTVDGEFRACIEDGDATEVFNCFSNPRETGILIKTVDDISPPKEYRGFTVFKGIALTETGIVVSLGRRI